MPSNPRRLPPVSAKRAAERNCESACATVTHSGRVVAALLLTGIASALIVLLMLRAPSPANAGNLGPAACPHGLKTLTPNAIADAKRAAMRQARELYTNTTGLGRGINTTGAHVVSAVRAARAGARGAQIRRQCGASTERRSVVVILRFPKMLPSGSLSEGVLFAGRFADGYHVWEVAH